MTDKPVKKAVKKAAAKKGGRPPALKRDEVKDMIADAVGQAVNALSVEIQSIKTALETPQESPPIVRDAPHNSETDGPALIDDEVVIDAQNLPDRSKERGQKVVEAAPVMTNAPSPEEVATWTPEQIAEFNANEVRKQEARKRQQEQNRSRFDHMSAADRMREYMKGRDPNVIRKMDNFDGEREIECTAIRKVGLGADGTSDVGETIILPVSAAKKLQASGAIRVNL